jgi:predicted nucleic acid-binding protein
MIKTIFVDTSAWFAGIDRSDQNHAVAIAHAKRLNKEKFQLITSNLVIHETVMLLERKATRKDAIRFYKTIQTDMLVEIVHATEELEDAGYALYQKYQDQDYSVTDCISFAVMNEYTISRSFTFDRHFAEMGFEIEPR